MCCKILYLGTGMSYKLDLEEARNGISTITIDVYDNPFDIKIHQNSELISGSNYPFDRWEV